MKAFCPATLDHHHDKFDSNTHKDKVCRWLRDNYPPHQTGGHNDIDCTYIKVNYGPYYAVVVLASMVVMLITLECRDRSIEKTLSIRH